MQIQIPCGSVDYQHAEALDRALMNLSMYYGQSKGKAAASICARIHAALTPLERPRNMVPYDDATAAEWGPSGTSVGRQYYIEMLRPLLADAAFLEQVRTTTLKLRTMWYPETRRTDAVAVLETALAYWDAHFHYVDMDT